jgi:uncharacterized membrane protein
MNHTGRPGAAAPLFVMAVLALVLVVGSLLLYPSLPARIPQHFGASGAPDRWVATSWISWMLPPIIAIAVAGFVSLIAAVLPRDLRQLNLPRKERMLALPPERHPEVLATIRTAMRWIAAVVLALFAAIQYEVYVVAREGTGAGGALMLVPFAGLALILGIVVWMNLALRRMTDTDA